MADPFESLKRVVRRLVIAEVAESWAGSKDAEENEAIENDVKLARKAYRKWLKLNRHLLVLQKDIVPEVLVPVVPVCKRCGDELKYKCPDCDKMTCGGCVHDGCLNVLSRRGWRTLGMYDG